LKTEAHCVWTICPESNGQIWLPEWTSGSSESGTEESRTRDLVIASPKPWP